MKTFNIFLSFTMKHSVLILVLTFLTLSAFQCSDCEEELHDEKQYSVNIFPEISSFSIGDSITLSSSMSSQINLELSNTIFDNSNQSIEYRIKVFKIEPNNEDATPARQHFEISNQTGDIRFPSSRILDVEISETCNATLCEFELDLIPTTNGYYGISLESGHFGFEDDCQLLSLIPNEIEAASNNFEICEEINTTRFRLDNSFNSDPQSIDRFYFFKVE